MSLLIKGGITRLSELIIDAAPDKAKDIAELILTTQGDILFRDPEAERLAGEYGIGMNFLHMSNSGLLRPNWRDLQGDIVYISGAVNRVIYPSILAVPVPQISVAVAEDHSGGGFTADKTLAVPVPTVGETVAKTDPLAVGGGIAHDDDVGDVDETAETNSPAVNDMHLLPSPGAVGDGFYFGLNNPFDWVATLVGQAGAGTWTITWKYWNGVTWANLTMKYNEINHWRTAGNVRAHWNRPGDWALNNILGYNLYWVKAECTAYTSMTVQPLGTQAWLGRYT